MLGVSYYFYMCWNAKYALLMLLSTGITYFASILMYNTDKKRLKTFYLVSSLVINLGILVVFKYFNFLNQTLADLMQMAGIAYEPLKLSLLLPVGISFYTFQALGYSIDVYKGRTAPKKHFGKYALFVSFFPQLVAGPIERIENLRPQFDKDIRFDYERVRSGLLMIGQGLIKKVVIADRLAVLVNTVYNSPESYHGIHFVIATVFFAFQIYCDFSGYSEIAIGSARIMGYELMENFRRPYLALTVVDFWKRWHISLTSWFRDNVYIPLGGNRKRRSANILIVFLISGLWHGASLTFVLWGFLNGLYQVAGIKLKPFCEKVKSAFNIHETTVTYHLVKRLVTFSLISFAWIFFRANSLGDLKLILTKLFTWNTSFFQNLSTANLGMDIPDILISCILIMLLVLFEMMQERFSTGVVLRREPLATRWLVYITIIVFIILFGVYGDATGTQFIYFQF